MALLHPTVSVTGKQDKTLQLYLPVLQIACSNQQNIMIREINMFMPRRASKKSVAVEVAQAGEVQLELRYVLGQSLRRELSQ